MSHEKDLWRDELAAAHRRIAALEEDNAALEAKLAGRREPTELAEARDRLREERKNVIEQQHAVGGFGREVRSVLALWLVVSCMLFGIVAVLAQSTAVVLFCVGLSVALAVYVARAVRRGHQRRMRNLLRALDTKDAELTAAQTRARIAWQEEERADERAELSELEEEEENGRRRRSAR